VLQPADDTVFRFECFALDPERGYLCDENGEIELRPKSFEVLRYLVTSAGRLVTKDEIIGAVWSNVTPNRLRAATFALLECALRRASVPSSSAPMSRLYPARLGWLPACVRHVRAAQGNLSALCVKSSPTAGIATWMTAQPS
jgi:hypothetical protein